MPENYVTNPRAWTVPEVLALMDAQALSADMFPQLDEAEGLWTIELSDERGNTVESVSFATEAEAEAFCVALGEAIEERT